MIDVGGLAVSPGFIDTHGHSEFSLLREPPEGKVFQGVTSEINGNCGLSAAPLIGDALRQREKDLKGIGPRWSTFNEYFRLLEENGLFINFATLAGHGNIRASVMGYGDRRPGSAELQGMKRLLLEALGAGAIGFSTGLIYPPGIYSDTEELIELAKYGITNSIFAGGRAPFIYASHMRSEGERLLEAIEEVIDIGRSAGVRVHVSHIKTSGRQNWHKADEAIALMDDARARGISLTCDRYPYTAASTDLDCVLPTWAYEGGGAEELKRLKDPRSRDKIKSELALKPLDWSAIAISTVTLDNNKWMEGKSMADIALKMDKPPVDALLDILIEEELTVDAVFHSMDEENLRRFLSLPYAMIGSDSTARSFGGAGKPHPRGFGTFPRFLKLYAEKRGVHAPPWPLSEAIRKITTLPAQTFNIKMRGAIKEGFMADIVVFDPKKIADTATFDNPYMKPEGIHHVIVNGVPVLSGGRLTGERPGRVLRHGG